MSQWEMVKLGDVAPSSQAKIKLKPEQIVWDVTLDQIESKTGCIINKKYSTISKAPQSSNLFDENNVLYSKLRPYLNKVIIPSEIGFATTELVPLRPDQKKLNKKFLLYILRSDIFVSWASENVAGAKMPRVVMSDFWQYKIPLPPLDIQKQIVARLELAQAMIDQRKQQLGLMDALIQSTFYEMFGDPVNNEKGWNVKPLSFFGDWKSGGTPSRNNAAFFGGSIPWISSGELNDVYVSVTNEHITEAAVNESAAKLIDEGSLLLGMYDTAALKSSINIVKMACNQAIAFSRLNDELCSTKFVYWYIQIGKEHFKRGQRGVRQKNLNLGMIKDLPLFVVPIDLQNTFAARVQKIEALKLQMTASLAELEQNFNALMQQSFAG